MPSYDCWEPLSIRLPRVALSLLSGPGETCEPTHNRARAIENMIHARIVPIGLLRETETGTGNGYGNYEDVACRSCGHSHDNPYCTDDYHG